MSKDKEIIIKKKSSAGAFFFGWFIGFILTVALIGGVLAFGYFKVSAGWVNKTWHTNIDLGSEELNNATLNSLVKKTINIAQNTDTYSINSLEIDFGITLPNEVMGIDISELKGVALSGLSSAVQTKLTNITAYDLRNVLTFPTAIQDVLSGTNEYYFNSINQKLYLDNTYTNEVSFSYTVGTDKITINGKDYTIANTVNIELERLPLSIALDSLTADIDENITVGDLRNKYNVTLPTYFDGISDETKLSELETAVNDLYLADFMGYEIVADKVMNGTNEVTGVMGVIAKKKVGELDTIESTINNMTVREILNYTNSSDNLVMNAIADTKINDLSTKINSLQVRDLYGETPGGILGLISNDTLLTNVANAISDTLPTLTINQLIEAGVIDAPANYDETKGNVTINEIIDAYFALP